ncbi:MAG: RluA family pseudouridine synthase [Bacteroidota bacterium]
MESSTAYSQLEVLYEDNHLIAVNKQCGDIVQGDKTGDTPLSETVKAFLKWKYDKPGNVFLGVVHRLDRPTSGVIVFAKTSKALTRMNKLFASGATQKIYWAVVQPAPKTENDSLVHWLVRNPKQNKSYAYPKEVQNSKKAVLRYAIRKHLKSYTLLEIQLETGRHHQIRAQLAAVGVYVKGDLKYGASRSNPDGGIHLHARQLSFVHPVSQTEIKITAPTPSNSIWEACE